MKPKFTTPKVVHNPLHEPGDGAIIIMSIVILAFFVVLIIAIFQAVCHG